MDNPDDTKKEKPIKKNEEGLKRLGDHYRNQLPDTFYDTLDDDVFNSEYEDDELAKLAGAETIFEYWDQRSDEPDNKYIVFKYFLSMGQHQL